METRRIASACFLGGATCGAVALAGLWWLGIMAGLALGYLTYDLKEVWEAIIVAASHAWREASKGLKVFLSHPYYHLQLFAWIGVFAIARWFFLAIQAVEPSSSPQEHSLATTFLGLVALMIIMFIILSPWLFLWMVYAIWRKGENIDHRRHARFCWEYLQKWENKQYFPTLVERYGYVGVHETYPNIARWFWIGLLWLLPEAGRACVRFIVTTITLPWLLTRFLALFFWHLFRLIHSRKRVLCAIDGTLGGVASYFLFAETADTATAKVVLVLAGGAFGSLLGVVNWEVVSKRWLRMEATAS